jgi:hypothetical protein
VTLSAKVGAFTWTTGGVGTTFAESGFGFQPKVILFFWGGSNSGTDAVGRRDVRRGFGVAKDTTNRWMVGSYSQDTPTTSVCDRFSATDACAKSWLSTGTVEGALDLQSIDADGFTMVVDDALSVAIRVHYLALGGADITDVATGMISLTSSGDMDHTAVGFQPNFVLLGANDHTAMPGNTIHSFLMLGMVDAALNQAVLSVGGDDGAATADTRSYCRAGECIAFLDTANAVTLRRNVSAMLSNGFRTSSILHSGSFSQDVFYLALRGGSYRVDNLTTSVTNGATIAETGFGFQPRAALLLSHGNAESAAATVQSHDQSIVGAFTSTTERGCQGALDEDAVGLMECTAFVEHDQCLAQLTTSSTVVGLVDVQSIDSDGFTLVMDSAANPAYFVPYVAFGDTPPVVFPPNSLSLMGIGV